MRVLHVYALFNFKGTASESNPIGYRRIKASLAAPNKPVVPNKPTPEQQKQQQELKDKIGHGCTVVSGALILGDAAILFSGQEYLTPSALSLSFHVWAV